MPGDDVRQCAPLEAPPGDRLHDAEKYCYTGDDHKTGQPGTGGVPVPVG